jgi:hypothetical protein
MSSLATKKAMATALAGAAIASSLAAPAVSARPVEQFIPGAAGDASESTNVPPPPSSIAASAAEEYEELRSPGAAPTESQPAGDESSPSNGFDLPSAAIGAAAGTGLVIVLLAAGGLARRGPLTRRHRSASA